MKEANKHRIAIKALLDRQRNLSRLRRARAIAELLARATEEQQYQIEQFSRNIVT